MDPRDEQLIRDAYATFVAADFDTLREAFHPDAVYVNPPEAIDGGTRRGREELVAMWRDLHGMFEFDSVEVEELCEGHDCLFAMVRFKARGRGSGLPTEVSQAQVFRLLDGRIAELRWFVTREEGLAEAGLS